MSGTYTNNVGRSDYRLPTVSANDNGKILKVVEGEWKKAEGGGGSSLPEYGESDAGKVLKVNSGATGVEWGEAGGGSGLPTYTATWDDSNIGSGAIYAMINTGGVPTLPFKISIPAYTLPAETEWADSGSELYGSGCVLIPNLLTSSGTAYITTFDNEGNIVLTGYMYVDAPGTIEGYAIPVYVTS